MKSVANLTETFGFAYWQKKIRKLRETGRKLAFNSSSGSMMLDEVASVIQQDKR
jgi:hypothetical protein